MSAASDQMTQAEARALLAADQSRASAGTSPPASQWPVDAYQNLNVTPDPRGGYQDAQGNNYFPAAAGPGLLADSKGNLYRATTPKDFMAPDEARKLLAADHVNPLTDSLGSVLPSLAKGGAGIAGIPGDLHNLLGNALVGAAARVSGAKDADFAPGGVAAPFDYAGADHVLTSQNVNDAIQSVAGPYYQPQTWEGRLVDTTGQMASAALFPGSAATRAFRVGLPTLTSDVAGETARAVRPDDPGLEGWARFGGALGGGVLQGGAEAFNNILPNRLSSAITAATPEQIATMLDNFISSRALPAGGMQVTPFEAGAQAGIGGLAKVQHFWENSPLGRIPAANFFSRRPGQVDATTRALAEMLSPGSEADTTPSMLGLRANRAANGALAAVRGDINAEAGPHYSALAGQNADPAAVGSFLQSPSVQKAIASFRSNPELNAPFAGVPDTNLAFLNEIEKHLGTMADQVEPTELNRAAGNVGEFNARLKAKALADALGRSSSPDYGAARDIVAQRSATELDPLKAGPVGTVAGTTDVPTATGAVYRPRVVGGDAAETATALDHLAGQDPDLPGALLAAHLRNTANATNGALRDLNGGPNQWGGAGLFTKLAGSSEQRAAVGHGAMAAGGPDAVELFDKYLTALQATGRRLPTGSNTAWNGMQEAEYGLPAIPGPSAGDPLQWLAKIVSMTKGAGFKKMMSGIEDLATTDDPDAVQRFIDQAKIKHAYGLGTALLSARAGASSP